MVALVAKLQLFCCFFVIALPTRCKVHFSVSCHVIHQCRNSSETRYVWQKQLGITVKGCIYNNP